MLNWLKLVLLIDYEALCSNEFRSEEDNLQLVQSFLSEDAEECVNDNS